MVSSAKLSRSLESIYLTRFNCWFCHVLLCVQNQRNERCHPHPQGLIVSGGCLYTHLKKNPYYHYDYFCFLGLSLQHMEVPRLWVELELQLPAYTTVTATPDPSHVCNLRHSSRQCQIPYPLSKAKDRTCVLMDTSWVHYH